MHLWRTSYWWKIFFWIIFILSFVNLFIFNLKDLYLKQNIEGYVASMRLSKHNNQMVTIVHRGIKTEIVNYDKENFIIGEKIYVSGSFFETSLNFEQLTYDQTNNFEAENIIRSGYVSKVLYYKNALNNWILSHFNLNNQIDNYILALTLNKGELANEEDLKKSGVFHLFIISGLHINLIEGAIILLFKKLNLYKEVKPFILIAIFGFYLYVCDFSISIFRACITNIIMQIYCIFHRKIDRIHATLFSALILFIINPFFVLNLGFELSYSLTFLIFTFAKWGVLKKKFSGTMLINTFACFISSIFFASKGIAFTITSIFTTYIFNFLVSFILIPISFILLFSRLLDLATPILSNIYLWLISKSESLIQLIASFSNWIYLTEHLFLYVCLIFFSLVLLKIYSSKSGIIKKDNRSD